MTSDGTAPVVTDGPFQEFKEWLAGYQIFDVESEERALEIAARLSAVPGPGGVPTQQPIQRAAGHGPGPVRRRRDGGVPADRGRRALSSEPSVEDLLRELAPQVLGALARRYGDFDTAEDAVQEALLAASIHWPRDGVPDNPRAWLFQTASRRLIDQWRSEQSRRERESLAPEETPVEVSDQDDSLLVLFMCCHPALTPASAIALTLRAVGGLTTAEIANAFLVSEATMAQRIARAKQRIKASGVSFRMPTPEEQPARLRSVLRVLYLIFNEGYASSTGRELQRTELSQEAIRLARMVHRTASGRRRGRRPTRAHAPRRCQTPRANRQRTGS